MPYVSAATLAYAQRPDKTQKRKITWLVDRPAGRPKGRICSRFTVETELMEAYQRPEEMVRPAQAKRDATWQSHIIHTLDETGVRSDSGQHWDLESVRSVADKETNGKTPGALGHIGTLVDRTTGRKRKAAIAVWPEDAKVEVTAIQRNVREVIRRVSEEVLIVVGAEFADGTEPGAKGHQWSVDVMRVKAPPELHLAGVKDKAGTSPMVLVAEPAVTIEPTADGRFTCTVHGWNEFNPITAAAHWRKQRDIRMWMLDTDYDGTQVLRTTHPPAPALKAQGEQEDTRDLARERAIGGCVERRLRMDKSPVSETEKRGDRRARHHEQWWNDELVWTCRIGWCRCDVG